MALTTVLRTNVLHCDYVDILLINTWMDGYNHDFFAPTAGTRSSISHKLCTVIEDVETVLKGWQSLFDSTQFFPGCTEKFGVIDRRVVSLQ